jgi:hypothetical protein
MKSFKLFCKQLHEATKNKTAAKYRAQLNRAKTQRDNATNALAPAKRKALDDLWYATYAKVSSALIDIEYSFDYIMGSKQPIADAKAKKFDTLIAKWDKESGPLLDAAKKNMDAAAAKWANEKDPCKRVFQKTIFQEIGGGSETDTEKEADIWAQVETYVSSPGNYGVVKKAYAELLKCKGSYSQLEPGVKAIYRGINVSLKTALKLVNISKLTDKKSSMSAKVGPKQMLGHASKYTPRYPVESWSSNPNVAYEFASGEKSEGEGYYEFSLSELRKSVNTLKRLIAKQQKIASKEKKSEDDKDAMYTVEDEIAYEIQDYINVYLASDAPVPVVYQITPDKYCVMNPLFSNKIGNLVGVGNEFEVTRIETVAANATVWIPQEVIDGAYLVAEIQDLIKQTKIKTPAIKVAVPVKLKKGR